MGIKCITTSHFKGKFVYKKRVTFFVRFINLFRSRLWRLAVIFGMSSVLFVCLNGCNVLRRPLKPSTQAEVVSGYTYIPIDPSKVTVDPEKFEDDLKNKKVNLLKILPDNTVRMSMEYSDAKGNFSFGVSKGGGAGSAYRLTADYVNSDTVNKKVWIRKKMLVETIEIQPDKNKNTNTNQSPIVSLQIVPLSQNAKYQCEWHQRPKKNKEGLPAKEQGTKDLITNESDAKERALPGTEIYDVKSADLKISKEDREKETTEGYEEFNVPIYVGIGLRIVAEGISLSSDANISGIGIIGAEAEAKRLIGSLTVQTLGINSQAVASALPVQSELSRTTAENAFVAIGSIKALLHQTETIKLPRVVGLYLPFPGGKPLVNALISELSRTPVSWTPNGYAPKTSDVSK